MRKKEKKRILFCPVYCIKAKYINSSPDQFTKIMLMDFTIIKSFIGERKEGSRHVSILG